MQIWRDGKVPVTDLDCLKWKLLREDWDGAFRDSKSRDFGWMARLRAALKNSTLYQISLEFASCKWNFWKHFTSCFPGWLVSLWDKMVRWQEVTSSGTSVIEHIAHTRLCAISAGPEEVAFSPPREEKLALLKTTKTQPLPFYWLLHSWSYLQRLELWFPISRTNFDLSYSAASYFNLIQIDPFHAENSF